MHPEIEKLLIVQEIDVQIRKLRDELARYPESRKTRTQEIERERGKMTTAKNRALELEKTVRATDVELRGLRDAMKKLMAQQSSVKNQKEYDALTAEIAKTDEKIMKADEAGIDILAEQELLQVKLDEVQKVLTVKEQEYAEEIARIDEREKEKSEQLAVFVARRKEAADGVDPAALHRYERLCTLFPANAVVPVAEGNCAGCFMKVLPGAMQKIARADALHECDSCHRILYLPK